MVDLAKIRSFVTVAETLNYTEAANRLFTSQATISKHIMALEQELGVKLINRDHRSIEVSAAGRIALPYAQQLLKTQEEMTAALSAQRSERQMRLSVRGIPTISQYKAFTVITEFSKQHPEIDPTFREDETDALLAALRKAEVDVVFARFFDADGARDFEVLPGEADRFVIVLPREHHLVAAETSESPLGMSSESTVSGTAADLSETPVPGTSAPENSRPIRLADVGGENFLLLDDSTGMQKPVLRLLAENGISDPSVVYLGRRTDLILGMIRRGMGVSVMMEGSFDLGDYPDLISVPLTPASYSHLAFVRRKGKHSAANDLFWNFARQRLSS
ncbi:MAG: LysR family transcriptional regulator [Bifidobacteriaceae bacterium]|nr:LysR family transcriptional regulator [Bifidobacteriaceae bacterium]MCI1978477.1 LysR family transcriptional regulator [Bifidobacteriaceae bacterium]